MNRNNSYDVIIVGAGFAGLYAIHRLRGQGLNVLCIEAAPEVGGVWYHNNYPGARCDLLSVDYSYSFSEELQREWKWSHRYSDQPEILAYLKHVADRFDLRRSIRFETRVTGLTRDDGTDRWRVVTDSGETCEARFVVLATGPLSVPKDPDFPGYANFKGKKYQASRFPHHPVSFAGKRVGVIGTGSSGIQTISEVAKTAGHLTVFQRTPNYTAPARNAPTDPEAYERFVARYPEYRREMKTTYAGGYLFNTGKAYAECTPEERSAAFDAFWAEGGLGFGSIFTDIGTNPDANDAVADYMRERMGERVRDPDVREKLMPRGIPIGSRRPCCDTNYLECFDQENVTLVDLRETPIDRFTESGIQTTAGHHALDMVIVALGFDAGTGAVLAIDPVNGKGRALSEAWSDGPETYIGMTVADFPNLFLMNSPGATSVFGNVPIVSEYEGDWIGNAITWVDAEGRTAIEATLQAQREWTKLIEQIAEGTPLMTGPSWYNGGNIPGKKRRVLAFLGGFDLYQARTTQIAENGYEGFEVR